MGAQTKVRKFPLHEDEEGLSSHDRKASKKHQRWPSKWTERHPEGFGSDLDRFAREGVGEAE